jgi:hypothetical protein
MKISLRIHSNGAFDIGSQIFVLRDRFRAQTAAQFPRVQTENSGWSTSGRSPNSSITNAFIARCFSAELATFVIQCFSLVRLCGRPRRSHVAHQS